MRSYSKVIVNVVGAGVAWGVLVLQSASGPVTGGEVAAGLILVATAAGVYGAKNA